MVVLVVVFLIPWLEERTRLRRAHGLAQLHLDPPWTIFYGLLVLVGVTNYLPTRFGIAAVCLALTFFLEYLGSDSSRLARPPAGRDLVVGRVELRPQHLGRSLERRAFTGGTRELRTALVLVPRPLGGRLGLARFRSGSIARPLWSTGRSG